MSAAAKPSEGCYVKTPQFVTFHSLTSCYLATQWLHDKFPITGNDSFMAPFFKMFWLFRKQTLFTFNGACNAFQKASKAHLIITLLVIFLTCYTKPYLFLPVDYVLVSHYLPTSQIFHAGCTCQPMKRPTCSSDDIVCFCPPCLAFSHACVSFSFMRGIVSQSNKKYIT